MTIKQIFFFLFYTATPELKKGIKLSACETDALI